MRNAGWLLPAVCAAVCSGGSRFEGPHDGSLRFSHALHLNQAGAHCLDCHRSVLESTQASDHNLPREAACLICHNESNPRAGHECAVCHVDPSRPQPLPERPRMIQFNHQLHLAMEGLPQLLAAAMDSRTYPVDVSKLRPLIRDDLVCTACHRGLERTDFAGPANRPLMWDCLVCHRSDPPEETCRFCHVETFDLRPESHQPAEFPEKHDDFKAESPKLCIECHSPAKNQCTQCH